MKKILTFLIALAISSLTFGQLTGVKTIPGDYASLAAAITDLNTSGVGVGGVTFNISAGYTETFATPTAGLITATGTATDQIIFQKSGAGVDPLITAGVGTSTTVDGIIVIRGGDYITFDGIDLQENVVNTTPTQQMEWGYALLKVDGTNGSQYNTIKNCTIALNKTNTASVGIYSANHTDAIITALTVTALSGTNSYNKIFGNTISNAFTPIYIIGFNDVTPFTYYDQGNEIGVTAGNTISNFGGASTSYGIYIRDNNNFQILNNNISNTGSTSTLRGIYLPSCTNASGDVNYNTINLTSAASTNQLSAVENAITGTATININNNNVTLNHSAATSGTLYGLYNNAAAVSNLNISNNTLTATTTGTGSAYMIYNSGAVSNLSISTNTLTATNSGTGSTYIINNSGAVTTTININNNIISSLTLSNATASQNVGFIYMTSVAATATTNINNNSFTGVNFSGTNGGTGSFYCINQTGTPLVETINGNIFNNLSLKTTGSIYLINNNYSAPANGSKTIQNNAIQTGLARTLTGAGSFYGYYDNGSSPSTVTHTINGNNFSNVSINVANTGTFYGIYSTDYSGSNPVLTVYNNIISNNISGNGTFNGIYLGGFNGTAIAPNEVYGNSITNNTSAGSSNYFLEVTTPNFYVNIYNNNINSNSSTNASATLYALYIGGTTNSVNVYKNKIYNISGNQNGTSVYGIYVSSGTLVSVYNNIIGDLRATAATGTNAVNGIYISGGTAVNAYYNTVNLNATSSSVTTFGTSGIYANTSPAVDLRNNIIVNTSTPVGATGFTVAYRRSSTTLTTYAATSNNNDFYAGATSATNLIYYDGTNSDQTLAAYKTRVATRDAASITENPNWVSTTGTDPTYLHISTTIPTSLESGGTPIATVTDDFDGDVRNATTPDIGADEFNGIPAVNCTGTPASSTIDGLAAVCSGTGTLLSLSTLYADLGMAYQWASSTVSGGPYTNMGTSSTQATGNLSVTTYYICTITCSYSALSFTTAEKTVTINALPNVTVTPNSASYCTPDGSAISLTASNASTYTWSPAAGLSAITGSNVLATPAISTTYTVTGTDLNGCINTANSVITVGYSVTAAATATPSTICSGANSQLLATGTQAFNTPAPSVYNFAGSTGTYTAITGTTLGSAAIGDDVGIGNLPIGFSFNYNGTNHTIFGARSNGLIELDQAAATLSGFSGNSLTTNANCIAALWDDNNTTGGSIIYSTTGTAGSRILTVQWTGMHVGSFGSSSNPTIDMQIKLYEGSNKIEFIYGSTSAALTGTSASIGISGAVGNFLSVTPLSPPNTSTVSSSTENTAISSATNFPSGTTYTFTPTGTPVFTYAWSPSTFITGQETLGNPLATAVTSTTPYTVTVTGNAGCSATASTTVTLSAGISINTQPVSVTKCTGETAIFTVAATGAGLTYQWRKDGVDIPIGTNASAGTNSLTLTNVSSSDVATYDVVISSTCGSPVTSDGTSILTVNPVPTATAASNSPICSGSTLNLTGTTDIGTSYSWTGPDGFTSSSQNPSISSAPVTATGTYSFTATLNGCTSIAGTTDVTVNASPQGVSALASQSTITCGASVNLTSTPNSGVITLLSENFNGATNSWTTTNTSTGGTNPADAAWTLQPDGYVYSSTTFHSNDNTQFYISNSDLQGSGGTTATTLESPAFSTIGMTNCSLSFFQYYRSISGSAGNVEVYNGTTWTSLAAFVTTQGGAAAFADTTISLNSYLGLPAVKIRFNYTASYGWYWAIDNVVISANNPVFTYAWTSTPAGFTSTDQNPVNVSPNVTTTYTVEVTNPIGCNSTANTTVNVNSIAAPVLGHDTTLCGQDNLPLNAGVGYDSYLWSTGATTQSITLDTAGIGLGTFHIWVRGTIGACNATDTIYVTFTPCLGTIENSGNINISIVPNPTNGITNIIVNGLKNSADLAIYTLQGQLIFSDKLEGNSTTSLDLSYLPKGVYLVRIFNEKASSLNKLVIQ